MDRKTISGNSGSNQQDHQKQVQGEDILHCKGTKYFFKIVNDAKNGCLPHRD